MVVIKDTYVSGEVASLVALAALHTLGGTRFRAVGSLMSLFLAVLAGEWVDARLRAITRAMSRLLTVDAGHDRGRLLVLGYLLLTVLLDVAKLVAVGAQGHATVDNESSGFEAL